METIHGPFDSPGQFNAGDRVELHPATDRWMMGDRCGSVAKVGRNVLTIKMDVSGKTIRCRPESIGKIFA